ncbi:MAG: hypothetical protein D6E12_02720 [Desulfovibrio sp.]|nr:MAG: hypothetical protein D6E12_02720 [Desulfovibrio sp.]
MSKHIRQPGDVVSAWEDETTQDQPDKEAEEFSGPGWQWEPQPKKRSRSPVGNLAQALKDRNSKARSKVSEPERRTRKKVSQVLGKIFAEMGKD